MLNFKKKFISAAAIILAAVMLAGCGNAAPLTEAIPEISGHSAVTETAETTEAVTETTAADTEIDTESVTEATKQEVEPAESTVKGPVSYYGELLAQDSKIVGAKTGEAVQVTGMSFFWSCWSQKFYTSDMVDKMKDDFKCEIVRASYGIDDDGTPYTRSDVSCIKTVVDEAIAQDMYVILDWHCHAAQKNTQEAVDYFTEMAKEYGSYDNVIFEIYNEPKDVDWSTVRKYSQTVIEAIRAYSDNLIVVGTPNWSQDVDTAAGNPCDGENLAYALHFYAGTHKEWLRSKAENAMKSGLSLMVTEWGSVDASGNGSINYDSTQEWIDWMDANDISWCNWAVNDKDETSSIFDEFGDYTETGKYIKGLVDASNRNAEWRAA